MVPSGPPAPVNGAQSVSGPSLLRTNSNLLGSQGNSVPSQTTFPSLISPRASQYNNNMNMLGNISNVSSLLNQNFVNGGGGSNSGLSPSGSGLQRGGGGLDMGAESDPLSNVGNGMGFAPSPVTFTTSNTGNPAPSGQSQLAHDQQQNPHLETQNFPHGQQSMQQFPQQYQSMRGGLSNVGGPINVKLEPQMTNDQNGQQQQQLQPLRNLNQVKLEPQQLPLRSLGPVKMEPQSSDSSVFLQQQQQQQQFLQLPRQSSQAAAAHISLFNQQRILMQQQQQQQQQQQILKSIPQQRSQLPQQFHQQSLPFRPGPGNKPAIYEPGMCARRLTHYMYHQQHRPADNNIEFWRKFVTEYFAPHAKKRWCVSLYGSGRQTTGVFPQDVWYCEICNRKPGRGFETTVEVLPRLCKIKYDSGTLEELLYVDMPREYQNASGQIVLDYAKAIQESVFEQLRVVRDGQLRIVFSSDLKICSWEFCARRHEELIPRRLIIPQVSQLGAVSQKYQAAAQNASSDLSVQDLQNNCNLFVASARQLAKALEVPLVNDLGYTKRYVRCLQISEVVNSMKDLIDYSRETGTGPMDSLINFPRRTATSSGLHSQAQQSEEQTLAQNSSNDQNPVQATTAMQLAANGVVSVNNSLNATPTSTSSTTIAGLIHQNSMNSRQENTMNNPNSPYGGGPTGQIPSASSSTALPHPSSPFPSPTPSASNNNNPPQASSLNTLPPTTSTHLNSSANSPANVAAMQHPSQANEADPNDSQSSVQQFIQEMMMSSQLNGGGNGMVGVGSLGNEMKSINGITQTGNAALNGGNCLVGNGIANGVGFGNMGGIGPSAAASGLRAAMVNNAALNGRVGMNSIGQDPNMNHQSHDLGSRMLSGLGSVNSFNNLQFDWKPSP
eukprot:TRINITY_DN235_c0_g2_i1.p1 TRINITY_DN235_c0_g2~~TRINITY_DN235_c0_g2_i1.p1  ORF type:complete len:892 (+),score=172.87 TRINITY_DN235_c0_g2_i1:310-2985(+)